MTNIAQTNELVKTIETSGVANETAITLKEKFLPFFEKAEEWKKKAESLTVTSIDQKREMQEARTARLALKDIRVEADKTRKALKEDSIRYGKAVQGVYNVIEYLIAPIEKHLEDQEKFAERKEAERKALLKSERETELLKYNFHPDLTMNLGEISEQSYNAMLAGAKSAFEAEIAEKKRLEEERIAKEKAEAEERERVRLENERLRKEAEERERAFAEERAKVEAERKAAEEKARIEREKAEAQAKKEAEAREKAQAELAAIRNAEEEKKRKAEEAAAAELKAKQEAERKAKAAPDREKLLQFAKAVQAVSGDLSADQLQGDAAKEILASANTLLAKVSTYINEKAAEL